MDDRAARLLGLRDGFSGLDPDEGLASGLRTWVDGGIECRGEVVCWAPAPAHADDAPGLFGDLTGWECSHNDFHLEDFVPVDPQYVEMPVIGVDAQRTLLRQGIALAREVGRLAGELSAPVPLRCIVAVGDSSGTFRFHRLRPGESLLFEDLDSYERGGVVIVDFLPRRLGRFQTPRIGAAQRAALEGLVELLAPDVERARMRLAYVLENASWSAFDPEGALIEVLHDGIDSGLVDFLRVIADPELISGRLRRLRTCPQRLDWDWYKGDPETWNARVDLPGYLQELAHHCRGVDAALIGIYAGVDGLVLGFLPEDRLERFIELAAVAQVEVVVYGQAEPQSAQ
ncbi:DUF6630 family protein [Nocardia goodfellowii]